MAASTARWSAPVRSRTTSAGGEYAIAAGPHVIIKREGDQLFAETPGRNTVELVPQSETEFVVEILDARVTFLRGDDGAVDRFLLLQAGQELHGNRIK